MDTGSKETGSGFRWQEEIAAHDELDCILDELSTRKQEGRKDDGQENKPDTVDLCSRSAYFGKGTWWLDRWLGRGSAIDTMDTDS